MQGLKIPFWDVDDPIHYSIRAGYVVPSVVRSTLNSQPKCVASLVVISQKGLQCMRPRK